MITIECRTSTGTVAKVFSGVEAIFFDKDGTLSRSEDYLTPLGIARAEAIAEKVPGTRDIILQTFGFRGEYLDPAGLLPVGSSEENLFGAAAQLAAIGHPWFDCLQITAEAFAAAERSLPPFYTLATIIPGTLDLFHRLARLPVKVAVVSGDSTPNIHRFLEHHQMSHSVDAVRGADILPRKPDPVCFEQVCEALGVNPSAVVMVGDATGDMAMAQAAQAAGAIGVLWGWQLPHHIDQADVLIDRWDQFVIQP